MRETHNDNHIKCAEDGGKKKKKKKEKERKEKERVRKKERKERRAVVGCSG